MAYSSAYARLHDRLQKIKKSFSLVIKFTASKYYFVAILILQILAWLQAFNIYNNTSGDLMTFHYNIDFGVDLVGEPAKIFYFPIAGLVISLLNLILSASFSRKQGAKLMFHLYFSTSILINTFLNLSLFAVYLINFM
ncbi:MAG TPA: hypothetical protein VFD51_02505 [Patescibacteria group bacterium]|nr:hypothetical protein [Patescibacteria group bacterium]